MNCLSCDNHIYGHTPLEMRACLHNLANFRLLQEKASSSNLLFDEVCKLKGKLESQKRIIHDLECKNGRLRHKLATALDILGEKNE